MDKLAEIEQKEKFPKLVALWGNDYLKYRLVVLDAGDHARYVVEKGRKDYLGETSWQLVDLNKKKELSDLMANLMREIIAGNFNSVGQLKESGDKEPGSSVEKMSSLENHLYLTIKSSLHLIEANGKVEAAVLLLKKSIETERLNQILDKEDAY